MGPGVRLAFAGTTRWLLRAPTQFPLRVPGLVRQCAEIDPDLAQRALVLLADIVAENQVRIGIAVQPTIVLDLVFQLTRRPAGIAQRQDRVLRPRALGDRLEDVDGGRQADAVV